jgi:DNA-binding NtrC family response regulator
VRELEHAIERAVLLATGELITAEDLGLRRGSPSSGRGVGIGNGGNGNVGGGHGSIGNVAVGNGSIGNGNVGGSNGNDGGDGETVEGMTLEGAERHLIKRALERHGGRVVDAAKALGVSRSALYRRLQALGFKAEE